MMSNVRLVFAGAVLFVISLSHPQYARAFDQDIACPPTIPAKSVQLIDTAEGWLGFVPLPLPLTAVGFMQAEPSKQAYLKPSSTSKTADGSFVEWRFEGPYPQGKWLSCDYAGGAVSLSTKIADSTSACAVTYKRGPQGAPVVWKLACK
jgi:hypothetical protein